MSIESTQDISQGFLSGVDPPIDAIKAAGNLKAGSSQAGQDAYSQLATGAAASSPMFSGYVYNPGDGGSNGINLNNATNSSDSQNRPNSLAGMVDPGGLATTTINATYGKPGDFRAVAANNGTLLGSMATSIATGTNLQGANEWEGFRNVFDGVLIGGGFNSKTRSLNSTANSEASGYAFEGYQDNYKYPTATGGLANNNTVINNIADHPIEKTGLRNITGFRLGTGDGENAEDATGQSPGITIEQGEARYPAPSVG